MGTIKSWCLDSKKPRIQYCRRPCIFEFKIFGRWSFKKTWGHEFVISGAHESKSSWFRDVRCSWRLDIKTPRLQSVLISWHHYLMMDWVQDVFVPFQCSFVPDIGFGNGLFASSDWPVNRRDRNVIFDPFFKSPEHYMFRDSAASCVFSYAK